MIAMDITTVLRSGRGIWAHIPANVWRRLGIRPGDRLAWRLYAHRVTVSRITPTQEATHGAPAPDPHA